jgi:hypothetical protein
MSPRIQGPKVSSSSSTSGALALPPTPHSSSITTARSTDMSIGPIRSDAMRLFGRSFLQITNPQSTAAALASDPAALIDGLEGDHPAAVTQGPAISPEL